MINSLDIKMGTCIRMDGKLFFVIDFLHVKPGKGNTFMRVKLKNVVDGRVLERRFDISEKLEDVRVERRPYQYLYKEGEDYIFMNQETYDQIPIAGNLITGVDFMKESDIIEVVSDASTEACSSVKCLLRPTSALLTLSRASRATQQPTLSSLPLSRLALRSACPSSLTKATSFRWTLATAATYSA